MAEREGRERQVIIVDAGRRLTRRQWRKYEQVGFRAVHDLDELVLNWSERKVKDLGARGAITGVQIEATLEGAPNVVVTLRDPERALFRRRAGRVKARKRSRGAGPVQVDEGWDPILPPDVLGRPMQISLDGVTYQLVKVAYVDGSGEAQLTFEHELVYLLKRHKGGKRAPRKKVTRAQFILSLVKEIEPEVRRRRYRFVCPELNIRQPIDKGGRTGSGAVPVTATSSGGQGGRNLDRIFPAHKPASGFKLTPNEVKACAAAGGFWGRELTAMEQISRGESGHYPGRLNMGGDGGIGLWQMTPYLLLLGGRRNWGAAAINYMEKNLGGSAGMRNPINNAKMARYLYEAAGKTFAPWFGTRYLTVGPGPGNGNPSRAEARELAATVTSGEIPVGVDEGTAAAGSTPGRTKNYQFARGAKESSWAAIARLGAEVKWRPFMVGNSLYYMSEEALYRRRPRYEVTPDHDAVIDLGYDIDWGRPASEATLVVTLAKWGAPPGSIILLDKFGPLDGRWLVASTSRDYFSPLAEVKLIQPAKPLLEPAAEKKQRSTRVQVDVPADAGGGDTVRGAIPGSPVPGQKPHGPTHPTSGLPGYMAYDYMAPAGTPCVAPVDGKISRLSGKDPSLGGPPGGALGYSIYVDGDNGKSYFLTHLDKVLVKTGQRVKQGQKIAQVANGPSSWSSPHVHMGVHG